MAVNDETLRIAARLRAAVASITDAQTRDLVAAWARAWDEVSIDLNDSLLDLTTDARDGRVSRTRMLKSRRLAQSLAIIGERLTDLAEQAGVRIIGDLPRLVEQAVTAQAAMLAAQLPPGSVGLSIRFNRADGDVLDAIVRRTTEQITARTRPLSRDATQVMKRELVRGIAVGDNPRETARRMVARSERSFNGGLTRALVISRSETLDAMREAGRVQDARNADVLKGWTWLADLGPRTCPACLVMHGTEHPVTDPGPLGHPACRCSRAPVTRSWAELGFPDLDEPASVVPDGRVWFDDQPEATQLAIMGRSRLDALSSGKAQWSDLATLRQNPDWRPSFAVTPVRDLTRRRPAA